MVMIVKPERSRFIRASSWEKGGGNGRKCRMAAGQTQPPVSRVPIGNQNGSAGPFPFAELTVLAYLLFFLFGVGVGIISGLFGIGGGIVLVPGLMLLFQFTQQEAQGTSLAAMIPPIGIFAA